MRQLPSLFRTAGSLVWIAPFFAEFLNILNADFAVAGASVVSRQVCQMPAWNLGETLPKSRQESGQRIFSICRGKSEAPAFSSLKRQRRNQRRIPSLALQASVRAGAMAERSGRAGSRGCRARWKVRAHFSSHPADGNYWQGKWRSAVAGFFSASGHSRRMCPTGDFRIRDF